MKKLFFAIFFSAVCSGMLSAGESPAVVKTVTAFGEGWKLTATDSSRVEIVEKLDAASFAGQSVVMDAKFCYKPSSGNGLVSIQAQYRDAAGKNQSVVLYRERTAGSRTLPFVRYAKNFTLPEKISDLRLTAWISGTPGELTIAGLRLIPASDAVVREVKTPGWTTKFTSLSFTDGLHAYTRNGKMIFRFDLLDDHKFIPAAAEKARGFVPFRPAEVRETAPGRKIRRNEVIEQLSIRSTPGQGEELFFAIGALRPLEKVSVSIGELKSADGKVLPASVFEPKIAELMNIYWGEYYRVIPKVQVPLKSVSITPECPRLYNLISKLPENTIPGIYKGCVTIEADGEKLDIPLTFEVLPFKLTAGKPYMFCYYHKADLEAFKWMRSYGANTVYLGDAYVRASLKDGEPVVDFSMSDKLIDCYRQSGMTHKMVYNPFHDGLASRALELAGETKGFRSVYPYGERHYIVPQGQYPAKSKAMYQKILKQVIDHAKEANYPDYYLHLMDEPGFQVDQTAETRKKWDYRSWYAKMEFQFSKEISPETEIFCTAYKLPIIDMLRPEINVGCVESSRISRNEAINFRETVHAWGQPYWGMEWPTWWDDFNRTRRSCGFLPADLKMDGFMIWVFYLPHTFDPDLEVDDFANGYHRTKYCYKDKEGNYLPTVAFEGVRAGANDWRYVETLRELIAELPENVRNEENGKLENILKSENIPLDKKRNYVIDRILALKKDRKL